MQSGASSTTSARRGVLPASDARVGGRAVLDEAERQFMTEFDYRCEAANLEAVAHNMK